MQKNKINDATKKLQSLVKNRKTQIVVTKQGSVKNNNRSTDGESVESYCYTDYNT